MMSRAKFSVAVSDEDRLAFAELSGDHNPLHVDAAYAAKTESKQCVLHGAFSAGLISRMAGMHLPGTECLLHGMRLRFIKPIHTPVELVVEGIVQRDDGENGEVVVTICEAVSGRLLVEGSYQFGRHTRINQKLAGIPVFSRKAGGVAGARVLVTGASGGLGAAMLTALGERGIGLTRGRSPGLVTVEDLEMIEHADIPESIDAIVHCAWPTPASNALLDLVDTRKQIEQHLAGPLRDCIALASLLRSRGTPGAILILVGSSFSSPGRHAWRLPIYSLSKSLIPTLTKILALELGGSGHRVVAVSFDVINGGMNLSLSGAVRQAHADRLPSGQLPTMDDAASQIGWILDNPGLLMSGCVIDLTGGAVP